MRSQSGCNHEEVQCLNQFELIRKYVCTRCGEVMMCDCDRLIGEKFLRHQLDQGSELETGRTIPVTAGFQPSICRECRGLLPEAHPVGSIPGRTTKIRRYYWRELAFREMELLDELSKARSVLPGDDGGPKGAAARRQAAEQAPLEIKQLHETAPKYTFRERSQAEIIQKYEVEVLNLHGEYLKGAEGEKARILDRGEPVTCEEFAARYFSRQGYSAIFVESVPFHVLFGVYMWLVIQDLSDPFLRIVGFGERAAFNAGSLSRQIWTHLPDDFGTPGYGIRRASAIRDHLSTEMQDREHLEWLFDYWLPHSGDLRQYLWAYQDEDIATARQLIKILPPEVVCKILKYLVGSYWRRYCGWPDLLVFRTNEFLFAEVKSSGDKLSEDQKNWIQGNYEILKLPFKLVKIHKRGVGK